MDYRPKTALVVLFGFSSLLMVLVAGCGEGIRQTVVEEVPDYRYPNIDSGNNLRLVSILTDPSGSSFKQGNLKSDKSDIKHSMKRPFAIVSEADESILLLDHGRGIVYRLRIDQQNSLIRTDIYPRGKRTFPSLTDLAVSPEGTIWLVDSRLKAVFMIDEKGAVVDSIVGLFERPVGITYSRHADKMLVTDLAENSIFIFANNGQLTDKLDSLSGLRLESPSFITTDDNGRVYVMEALTAYLRIFDAEWNLTRTIGGIGDGPGFFAKPKGVAVDSDGRIYVADALFDNVQIFDNTGSLLLALGTTGGGAGEFWQPTGLSIDNEQRLYVADSYNRRVQIFRWETGE